jgi:HEAT repeat protein
MRAKGILLGACVALCVPAAASWAGDARLPALLEKMHKVDSAEGQQVLAEMLKLGPEALEELCGMVVPPGKGDDAKAHYALHGLALYASRPDAEAERKALAAAFLGALESASDRDVKAFFIRQLQLAGKDEAVPALARLLPDPILCDPAAQALTRIGTPAAVEALVKALAEAKCGQRVSVITALGTLRAKAAAPTLLKDAASEDPPIRSAALYAVANLGDPAAASLLAKAADAASPYERSRCTSFYLLFASRRAEAGDKAACARICRELLKMRKAPRENGVICSALATLVAALGRDAMDDLLAAMDHEDAEIRAAAMKIAETRPDPDITVRLIHKCQQAPVPVRAQLLGVLSRRGDKQADSFLLEALQDREKAIRVAAIPAVAHFDKKGAIEPLLYALRTTEPDEVALIQRTLMPLVDEGYMATVAATLPKVPPRSRVALLEILGGRRATGQAEAVVAQAKDPDPAVRQAAMKALGALADEKMMRWLAGLLLDVPANEQGGVQRAIVLASQRIPDADKRADPVLAELKSAEGPKRALLLAVLPRIGGSKALETVLAHVQSSDDDMQVAAARALSDWSDPAAAPELLKLARAASRPAQQILALRGYIRLASAAELPDPQKVGMLKEALALAKRPDEKRLVLAGLGTVRTLEALQLIAPCLDDKELQAEAGATAAKIACPGEQGYKGLAGAEVAAVLQKVLEVTTDANIRKQVEPHLKKIQGTK